MALFFIILESLTRVMRTINLEEVLKSEGNNKRRSVLSLYQKTKQHILISLERFKDMVKEVPEDDEELVQLLSEVNKRVKDPSCPNNLKNKFYVFKHKFLTYCLSLGLVSEVIESPGFYKFVLGDYSFHQPKSYFKEPLEVNGEEEYKPEKSDLLFSRDLYDSVLLGIILKLPMK
jgi:hypothetical protein